MLIITFIGERKSYLQSSLFFINNDIVLNTSIIMLCLYILCFNPNMLLTCVFKKDRDSLDSVSNKDEDVNLKMQLE